MPKNEIIIELPICKARKKEENNKVDTYYFEKTGALNV